MELAMLKRVVFAPMQTASVSAAERTSKGSRPKLRMVCGRDAIQPTDYLRILERARGSLPESCLLPDRGCQNPSWSQTDALAVRG